MEPTLPKILGNLIIELAQKQDENEMLKEQIKRLEQELAKVEIPGKAPEISLVQNK